MPMTLPQARNRLSELMLRLEVSLEWFDPRSPRLAHERALDVQAVRMAIDFLTSNSITLGDKATFTGIEKGPIVCPVCGV